MALAEENAAKLEEHVQVVREQTSVATQGRAALHDRCSALETGIRSSLAMLSKPPSLKSLRSDRSHRSHRSQKSHKSQKSRSHHHHHRRHDEKGGSDHHGDRHHRSHRHSTSSTHHEEDEAEENNDPTINISEDDDSMEEEEVTKRTMDDGTMVGIGGDTIYEITEDDSTIDESNMI